MTEQQSHNGENKIKKDYDKILETQITALSAWQRLRHASNRYALLFIVHGMNTADKYGTVQYYQRKSLTPKFEDG